MAKPAAERGSPLTYADYAAKLRFFCRQKRLKVRRLGIVKGYPLLQIVGGPGRPAATLVFSAGIHGDETSGPLAILELIRRFDWGRLRRTRVVLLPVGNPWGFDHGRRTDASGRDLNRGFGAKRLHPEQRLLLRAASAGAPELFLSLHEDDEQKGLYVFAYGREERSRRVIVKAGSRHVPLSRSRRIDGRPVIRGAILDIRDGSLEQRLYQAGVPESLCLELPDKRPLAARIRAGTAALAALIRQKELEKAE